MASMHLIETTQNASMMSSLYGMKSPGSLTLINDFEIGLECISLLGNNSYCMSVW